MAEHEPRVCPKCGDHETSQSFNLDDATCYWCKTCNTQYVIPWGD